MSTDQVGAALPDEDEAVRTAPRTSPGSLEAPSPENGENLAAGPIDTADAGQPANAEPRRPRNWAPLLRVLTVLLLVLLPTAGAAFVSAQQPPTYAAVAEVLYHGVFTDSAETIERELATQVVLILDRTAIERAAAAVRRPVQDVTRKATVEVVESSNVLRLRVEDRDRNVARALAESLLTEYTTAVEGRETSRLTEQQEAVDARMTAMTERLAAVDARSAAVAAEIGLRTSPTLGPPATLAAEQRALESEAQVLRQQIANLEDESLRWSIDNPDAGLARVEVIAGTTLLDQPVGPQPLRAAAGGALLGLVLALAWVVSVRRRRSAGNRQDPVAAP